MKLDALQWKAYEYHHRDKGSDWFWAVGIIAFSASAASVIFNNVIFAIFIILSAFTLSLYAARKPSLINIEINNKGIVVGKYLHPYQTLEKFCVTGKKHGNVIILKSKKTMFPYVTVQMGQADPDSISEYLSQFLTEEEMFEPLTQTIIEYLGF